MSCFVNILLLVLKILEGLLVGQVPSFDNNKVMGGRTFAKMYKIYGESMAVCLHKRVYEQSIPNEFRSGLLCLCC